MSKRKTHTREQPSTAQEKAGLLKQTRPATLFLSDRLPIDEGALDQLYTALRLPVAAAGAAMPDLHPGYSLPIGGVVALNQAISPAFVGYDIGCRVSLSVYFMDETDLQFAESPSGRSQILQDVLESTSFGLGSKTHGLDHPVMHDRRWKEIPYLRSLRPLAQEQLGSSGSGNHFADIVIGENLQDTPGLGPSGRRWLGLLTHSGSRGSGNKAAHYYADLAEKQTRSRYSVPRGYGWLDLFSDLGQEYLQAMDLLGQYASANHELIHERFSKRRGDRRDFWVENFHNFAWVEGNGERVIHRKGATPANKGQLGLIPGSSRSFSYLVEGLGNPDAMNSAAHGAGRARSRTASKAQLDQAEFFRGMNQWGITYHGVAGDETWMAYKDIELVMEAQRELVRPLARMRPRVVVMGGHQKSDDGD